MERTDALLVSINDRLGALAPSFGSDIAPLNRDWLLDVVVAEKK